MPPTSPTGPRIVDATRPPGVLRRAFAAIALTRPLLFFSRHVSWKLDPVLLRLTRGRVASTMFIRTAVLETRGARTGERRRNAVIYWHDGDRITIAASQAGSARNPAWYHNLLANPEVTFGGAPMTAVVVADNDRERLWTLGDRVFPAFATYRERAGSAGRTIPLIQLLPNQTPAPNRVAGLH
jgi:deazaflavin-dependent oxidoreductase (nitroreductase family)